VVERDIYPQIYQELENKGWRVHDKSQVREEVRVGKKRSDILLYDNKGDPLAVIEVKDEGPWPNHPCPQRGGWTWGRSSSRTASTTSLKS